MAEIKDKVVSVGGLKVVFDAIKSLIESHVSNRNNPHGLMLEDIGGVPDTRTINGKPLSSDIVLEVDSELSETSENPVQNKAIYAALQISSSIPPYDETDNGKILCIVNGVASWEGIASAESEYY